jgi:hypothetical protein
LQLLKVSVVCFLPLVAHPDQLIGRPELTGGGLIRSSGGWSVINTQAGKIHFKSDERILGDSNFVDKVLKTADEALERKYQLKTQGYDLNALAGKSQDKKPFLPLISPRAWVYNDGAGPKAQNFSTSSQYKCSAWCAY